MSNECLNCKSAIDQPDGVCFECAALPIPYSLTMGVASEIKFGIDYAGTPCTVEMTEWADGDVTALVYIPDRFQNLKRDYREQYEVELSWKHAPTPVELVDDIDRHEQYRWEEANCE